MIPISKATSHLLICFSLLWRCRHLLAIDQHTAQLIPNNNLDSVLKQKQQQSRRLQFSSCKMGRVQCQNNISKIIGRCSKKTQQQLQSKLAIKSICAMEWLTCQSCLRIAKQCRIRSQQPKTTTPTRIPTNNPSRIPTAAPLFPTNIPSKIPTISPLSPTNNPTRTPPSPTNTPLSSPTLAPLSPTNTPLSLPTLAPMSPTVSPMSLPTFAPLSPTRQPLFIPTYAPPSPTNVPSTTPIKPTLSPINTPTSMPFASLTHAPLPPTSTPSTVPKHAPLSPTSKSSFSPTSKPSTSPTASPHCIFNNGATAPCNANNTQKKGIGLMIRSNTNGSCSDRIPILKALNVHWNYGWNYDRSSCQPTSSNFIPMAWNGGRNASDLRNRINNANIPLYISNGTITIMFGFNEPDLTEQANMPVAVAIERWSVLQELGIPLVSPSAGNPEGMWMKEFMGNATALNLRIDYIGVHSYAGVNFPSFVNKMTRIYNLYQKPLVLTEFASADWAATTMSQNKLNPCQVLSFMKQVLPWLEETWWIHSYAWFPFSPTSIAGWPSALFDQNNTLTVLGRYYQSVNHQNRYGDDVSCP